MVSPFWFSVLSGCFSVTAFKFLCYGLKPRAGRGELIGLPRSGLHMAHDGGAHGGPLAGVVEHGAVVFAGRLKAQLAQALGGHANSLSTASCTCSSVNSSPTSTGQEKSRPIARLEASGTFMSAYCATMKLWH